MAWLLIDLLATMLLYCFVAGVRHLVLNKVQNIISKQKAKQTIFLAACRNLPLTLNVIFCYCSITTGHNYVP